MLASYAEQEHFRASVSLVKVESYREVREVKEIKEVKEFVRDIIIP